MIYNQTTGILSDNAGVPIAADYYKNAGLPYPPGHAGNGAGYNNPAAQYEHNVGPLPGPDANGNGGLYRIGAWGTHAHLGPISAPLTPLAAPTAFDPSGYGWLRGRGGFYCHGPVFSEGCVVQEEPIRLAASRSGDTMLRVVSGLPSAPATPEAAS
jgi:hypothetical protein